jgi:hypothetical protein
MTLLNPAGLLFAGLVPVIILLYLLKLRRQPAQVSTLMFWQRVVADNRRRALFQRLRQLLSLLLHLLIFALLLLALARPEFGSFRGGESGTVVVLDCRARMQTRAGGGSNRFAEAVRIAQSYLRRASNRQPVALLALDSAPRVVCDATGDERVLLDALDRLRPVDAGGRIEDAVQLGRELLGAGNGAGRVIVVTDQTPPIAPIAPEAAAKSPVEVETRLVDSGGPRENVGIVRLDARPLPGSPETDEVLVEIGNFGVDRQAGSVELTFEGRLLDVKPFDLAPGERRTDVYPALAAQTGIANARGWLSAHLALKNGKDDALALDDNAYAVIPPPRPIRVLLVTRGNWFLENLLKADDGVKFDQLAPDAFQPGQAAGFDAVILDDCVPAGFQGTASQLPPGNFLFVGSAPFLSAAGGKEAAVLEHPLVTDADAASPLLRRLSLRDVTILRAQSWSLPETAADASSGAWQFTAPVRSFDHPLVVAGERRPANGAARPERLVGLAFGVGDSDLPLRVAFPLFVHNALDWLADRDESAAASDPVRAGDIIEIQAGAQLWTQPQRSYQPIGQIPAAELIAGPGTFQPLFDGFYLLRESGGTGRWIAVDTLDPEMSAVNAERPIEPAAAPAQTGPAPVSVGGWWDVLRIWPAWVELALLAFVLCTLEWWGFHRRRTE